MMLLNKNHFLNYSNLLRLLSFNIKTINSTIFNIRNIIKYVFFFILKKNYFLKLLFSYNIFLYLLRSRSIVLLSDPYSSLLHTFFLKHFFTVGSFISKTYFSFSYFNLNKMYFLYYNMFEHSFYIEYYTDINVLHINYFFFLYKMYIFILYMWLYSLKFLNFYSISTSSLPTKRKLLTVLRSPHKDKKSREQFKISKLKKNFIYPSFINNKYFFSFFSNETILIKNDIFIIK